MARGGNDRADALAELAERYRTGAGNAGELIDGVLNTQNRELLAASNKRVDDAATQELTTADVASAVDVDEDAVQGYAVRGDTLVAVVEDKVRSHKLSVPLSDLKAAARKRAQKAEDPGSLTGSVGHAPVAAAPPAPGDPRPGDVGSASDAGAQATKAAEKAAGQGGPGSEREGRGRGTARKAD